MAVLNVSSGINQDSYDSILRLIDEKADELFAASSKNEDKLTNATA